jgi:TPR repeat protein
MKHLDRKLLFAIALSLGIPSLAFADVVFLKGGQRLEGDIAEKGAGFEIKNEFGSWSFTKDDVVKIVKSVDRIVAEGEALREKARTLYTEAIAIENDTKTANAKLRQGLDLLRKIADLYNEAMETYPDPKYGHLQKTVVTIFQEMRLYRDKIHSEIAPVVAAPKPEPAPVITAPAKVIKTALDPAVLLPKAMAGDLEAMFLLGTYYDDKEWVSTEGLKWLRAAAEKNHPRAQFRLGLLYKDGKGVKQDVKEAQKWFQKADGANLPLAAFSLGMLEWQGSLGPRSLEKTYSWCDRAAPGLTDDADRKDAEALAALGWMYQEGMGRPTDLKKAADFYKEAAEQGYAPVDTIVAGVYLQGKLGEVNRAEAERLLTKAAERGYAEAQVSLGELFDEYTGRKNPTGKDFKRAQPWYQKAADQGHGRALYRLGLIQLDGKGVAKNPVEANRLFQASVQKGTDDFLKGLYNDLGYVYERGLGVKQDVQQCLKYYKMAADLGSPEAQFNLGSISLEKNQEKDAYKWFVMAAKQGHAMAQNNLGAFHAAGRGVKKSLDDAEKWFLMAAQQGDPSAAENLKKLQRERAAKKP